MANLRSAAAKAVHLKVYPRPSSLSESRELLHVLQQFGEVTTFKSLRFDYVVPAPNTCLAIYRDAASATKLLKASPLRFTLEQIGGYQTAHVHDHDSQPNRDDGPVSALGSKEHHEVADILENPEFDLSDGPSKTGAEEMVRPSTLLFRTIDSFSQPEEASSQLDQEPPSNVSDATQSEAGPASSDAAGVSQREQAYAVEQQPQPQPENAPQHVSEAKPPRTFHVVADISEMNHRDHIERSFWYGPYQPRKRSASYMDLTARGVPSGVADLSADKPEQSWKYVSKLRKDIASMPSLKQIWEQGQAQRAAAPDASSVTSDALSGVLPNEEPAPESRLSHPRRRP